ncbi:MAG: glutamate--tRNA ligase [Coriobacteriia bacterium]|nr:glutamate--tRNA ligase [Coriobacteriia bacterium]
MTERLRFSPSPSGGLHMGGARTALFDWLVARRARGSFLLRIEDTDRTRSTAAAEAAILADLSWLGLDWDEGPDIGGPHAPYRQSERAELYERTLLELRAAGATYPCFCPPELLERQRAEDEAARRPPRYRGTCRVLSAREARGRIEAGEAAAWRFAVPEGRTVEWVDGVHGRIAFAAADIGDFLLVRSDGRALYDLACVSDDAAMRVTLVLRGDDHVPNTPRQLLLYEALGRTPPAFAHLPLVIGADGAPLSKSAGDGGIGELRGAGYLPEAVIDHLARLGWSDPLDRPALTRDELLATFELARISPAPPRHDPSRLRALNVLHLRALPPSRLAAAIRPHLPPLPGWFDLGAFAEAVRGELEVASDARDQAERLVSPPPADEEARRALAQERGAHAVRDARDVVAAASPFEGEAAFRALRERLAGEDARRALPAVRAALTGRVHGLPLPVVFSLLGKGRSLERLTRAAAAAGIDSPRDGNG